MNKTISTNVIVEQRGPALWLTLNRPETFNALNAEILSDLDAAMDRVENDRTIRIVVITGAGKAFCAGADLKGMQSRLDPGLSTTGVGQAHELRDFLRKTGKVFDRLERLGVPTIALINGVAMAGGLELILCCDVAIALDVARIGDGHAKFAQLPGAGGSVRLPKRIGASRAKYMMFTGELLSASQSLQWGLVDFVSSAEDAASTVEAVVSKMVPHSPLVLERMKSLVHDGQEQPRDVALRAEIDMGAWHSGSQDRLEGLAAFMEKRVPVYRGE